LPEKPGVLVVRKHHFLVRWGHWLNVPILLGLILSGISIYWASPVYQHKPDPNTGTVDVAADIGIWICAHVPGLHHYSSLPDWIYNHMSLGPGMLALALRLHWLCAYLFMLNGILYVAGLVWGGGWRSLLPRRTDLLDTLWMFRYYLGVPFAKLARRKWLHPFFNTKYNALQRAAYSLFQSRVCFRSLRDGRFTSPCNSIGWQRSLEGTTQRVSGIFGLCGSTSNS
jgi:thiosulfate reductase cytochrome b subunit